MKKILTLFTMILVGSLAGGQAWCQVEGEGIGQSEDVLSRLRCIVSTDFYMLNFTAFQPKAGDTDPREMFKPYCRDLPGTGKTYLTVDLIDRDTRQMPISLRVIEEGLNAETGEVEQLRTIKEVAAQRYNTGVVETQVTFDKEGHYALLVGVGESASEEDIIKIDLNVGIKTAGSSGGSGFGAGLIIVLGTVALMIYMAMRLLRQRRSAP